MISLHIIVSMQCWGRCLSLSHSLSKTEGNETKEFSFSPAGNPPPPQCSQDPCGDPSHSLRLNSDPPLAKRQNDPQPPSGEVRLTYQVL